MPIWLRIAYAMPFLDRYVYVWMWHHGWWWIDPPPASGGDQGAGEGGRPDTPPFAPATTAEFARAAQAPADGGSEVLARQRGMTLSQLARELLERELDQSA